MKNKNKSQKFFIHYKYFFIILKIIFKKKIYIYNFN